MHTTNRIVPFVAVIVFTIINDINLHPVVDKLNDNTLWYCVKCKMCPTSVVSI